MWLQQSSIIIDSNRKIIHRHHSVKWKMRRQISDLVYFILYFVFSNTRNSSPMKVMQRRMLRVRSSSSWLFFYLTLADTLSLMHHQNRFTHVEYKYIQFCPVNNDKLCFLELAQLRRHSVSCEAKNTSFCHIQRNLLYWFNLYLYLSLYVYLREICKTY